MSDRLSTLLQHLENDKNEPFLYFAIAKEFEKNNDFEKALTYYLQLKEKDESYLGLYYHLGKLYELLELEDLALSTYNDGILLAKRQADHHSLSELLNAKTNLELGI